MRNMIVTLPKTLISTILLSGAALADEPVTVDTFVRAETDMTMQRYVDQGAFGQFYHIRQPTPMDAQDVIRMNRDTLYSAGVFDLTKPVTIVKPEANGRFQSMLIINQDHSMEPVEHDSGEFTLTQEDIGSRYVFVILRTFVDANSPDDIAEANALQDQIIVKQEDSGKFEIPEWNEEQLVDLRVAVNVLAATKSDIKGFFGDKEKLNPIDHLLGTAYGWGGNPVEAAVYQNVVPAMNDGTTPHSITLTEEVPVDGFASITIYNADGYMEPNELNSYSFNSVTAVRNDDGSVTVNAGGCDDGRPNCIPITVGWNYIVRLYQPKKEVQTGEWVFPTMAPVE
ncbi:DUF1254 domain-containing protein [Ruegeria hyattellae]|uniref:DUF1254 domain-containing protein n=1 Tax=Ruegeria hyattellae TaxID=3233337 RepID=UPI00355ACF63